LKDAFFSYSSSLFVLCACVCADGFKLYEKVGEKEIIRDKGEKEKQLSKMKESQSVADSLLAKSEKLKEHAKKVAVDAANRPPIVRPTPPTVHKLTSPADKATTSSMSTIQANGANDSAAKATPVKRGRSPDSSDAPGKKAKMVEKRSLYLGERVAKVFEQEDETGQPFQELYFGNIDRHVSTSDNENPLWHVQYDDDDEEEFDEKDVKAAIKLYVKEKINDPKLQVAKVAASTPEVPVPAGKV
jgi:hypothetical protein